MKLVLPSDALVVLVGPAGCGKSTFAERHFRSTEVVSSDECRALVSDDPANAAASRDAFKLMHLIVDMRLKRGRMTVADATNLQPEKRAELLERARRHRRPAIAVVFDLPAEVCLERNASRARRVPPAGVYAHRRLLGTALAALPGEGFAAIHVLTAAEDVDGLVVRRVERSHREPGV